GAGKTTFCQQFVDDESKELLKLTITDSAESTVIQTDILILDNTPKKLFLRARNKTDIMKDLLMVALELDLDLSGDAVKDIIRKNTEIVDKDTIDKVNNCFLTEELFSKYKFFGGKVQEYYKATDETEKLK
ncbi:hypothetical protein, partial [Stenotrophomonas maltophilia group sp. RNC7]|uniref:hypothetical protein n=1 Tax=Stenotrophomonas maltophilia group sp. RNC7 TaxID=3071467 RepID=UPI0027E06842